MAKCKRRQLFIDEAVQGAILYRIIVYWIFWLATVLVLMLCWVASKTDGQPFCQLFADRLVPNLPALLTMIIVLPLVLVDAIRLSNRFVGPIYKLQTAMTQLARGELPDPVQIRHTDYWGEVTGSFNQALHQFEALKAEAERTSLASEQVPDAHGVASYEEMLSVD